MTTSKEATARPWHVGVKQAEKIIYTGNGWAVANCTVYHGTADAEESAANAALIVRAVNAHDAMREALERIAAGDPTHTQFAALAISEARAAIALGDA